MKLKSLAIIALGLICSTFAFSQEEKVDSLNLLDQKITSLEDAVLQVKKLKISGYVQSEWQMSQIDINGNQSFDMKVGSGANAWEKANAVTTPGANFSRFGVRRGRLKATYTDNGCVGVFYIDATEKGVVLKEAYVAALDPWVNILTLKGGVFNRPFGYEIEFSSSSRESPERSRIIQTLFPSERDLGGMITLQAPKTSPWNVLKLDAGLLAGNAIGVDLKSQKDFIAHLTYNNSTPTFKYGIGVSMYNGYVFQPTTKVYKMAGNVFTSVGDSASNKNQLATRQYFGADGQFSIASDFGLTTLRAEYISGTQPGTSGSTSSYNNTTTIPANDYKGTNDIYIRKFSGGYIQLSQDIADTKNSLTVKYDWYDPNTDVAGNNIGVAGSKTGKADIAYSTIGFGYLYRMNNNVKFMVYYDIPTNETSSAMTSKGSDFTSALKANILTVRMQYKF